MSRKRKADDGDYFATLAELQRLEDVHVCDNDPNQAGLLYRAEQYRAALEAACENIASDVRERLVVGVATSAPYSAAENVMYNALNDGMLSDGTIMWGIPTWMVRQHFHEGAFPTRMRATRAECPCVQLGRV